jgi:hypothetical protein
MSAELPDEADEALDFDALLAVLDKLGGSCTRCRSPVGSFPGMSGGFAR